MSAAPRARSTRSRSARAGSGHSLPALPYRDALIDAVMGDWSDRINADSEEIALSDLPAL